MTITTFLIFAFAVSLIVGYILIIHSSLSGPAANDPNFDASGVVSKGSAGSGSSSRVESISMRQTPRHA